ncbi:MAG: hypothetical protein Fur0032_20400 [Terrimicrobiaceae bacterium]
MQRPQFSRFFAIATNAALTSLLPACKTLPESTNSSRTPSAALTQDTIDDSLLAGQKPFFTQEGIASWYGGRWIGRKTANGEHYRADDFTAAHRTLPFHSRVRVTDLRTGKSVIVRINNRGPYIRGRIIDISVAAAKTLGFYGRGLTRVRIEAYRPPPKT